MTPLVAAQVLLSLTLLVSGLSKIRDPRATEDAMRSLRLPARKLHPLASRLIAPTELALAVLAWIPVPWVQTVVAAATLALMTAFLVTIARALTFPEKVSCSCFGTLGSPTVSRATLGRNIVLVALSVIALIAAGSGITAHTELHHGLTLLGWALALTVTALLTVLTMGISRPATDADPYTAPAIQSRPSSESAANVEGMEDVEELDYERTPIPHALVRRSDGELATLHSIATGHAALLVWINPGCGPCERILDKLPAWREQLTPYVVTHVVVPRSLDSLFGQDTERVGAEPLEDIQRTLSGALGIGGWPAAVLLGADGMLAGGPVLGAVEVEEFIEQVIEQIADAGDELQQARAEEERKRAEAEAERAELMRQAQERMEQARLEQAKG